jgi:hypothetical protein
MPARTREGRAPFFRLVRIAQAQGEATETNALPRAQKEGGLPKGNPINVTAVPGEIGDSEPFRATLELDVPARENTLRITQLEITF